MLKTPLFYPVLFCLGLVIGSFINCLVWRCRNNVSLLIKRSYCDHCGRPLAWWENIPFFSFFFLRFRCRVCLKPIPAHYHVVEISMAAFFVLVGWLDRNVFSGNEILLLRDLFFVSVLMTVFVYDLFYQLVLPSIVWAGLFIGFIVNVSFLKYDPLNMLIAGGVGAGFFLLQYLVSKGRWIGGGDVRLGAMLGVWVGWPNVLVALFFAYIVGAIFAVFLLIFRKKNWRATLPLGTFLALGTFFALYWGGAMVNWYLGMIR